MPGWVPGPSSPLRCWHCEFLAPLGLRGTTHMVWLWWSFPRVSGQICPHPAGACCWRLVLAMMPWEPEPSHPQLPPLALSLTLPFLSELCSCLPLGLLAQIQQLDFLSPSAAVGCWGGGHRGLPGNWDDWELGGGSGFCHHPGDGGHGIQDVMWGRLDQERPHWP